MAQGDIGMFLPSESHYKYPGAYSQALKAEAVKTANYLSSMDQFYAQLEESQRQFNEMLAFREDVFARELEFNRWRWEETFDIQRERLDWEREYGTRALDIEEDRLDLTRDLNLGESVIDRHTGGVTEEEQLDFLRDIYMEQAETSQQLLQDIISPTGTTAPASTPSTPAQTEPSEGMKPNEYYVPPGEYWYDF